MWKKLLEKCFSDSWRKITKGTLTLDKGHLIWAPSICTPGLVRGRSLSSPLNLEIGGKTWCFNGRTRVRVLVLFRGDSMAETDGKHLLEHNRDSRSDFVD